jgi:hypothetical protein
MFFNYFYAYLHSFFYFSLLIAFFFKMHKDAFAAELSKPMSPIIDIPYFLTRYNLGKFPHPNSFPQLGNIPHFH